MIKGNDLNYSVAKHNGPALRVVYFNMRYAFEKMCVNGRVYLSVDCSLSKVTVQNEKPHVFNQSLKFSYKKQMVHKTTNNI